MTSAVELSGTYTFNGLTWGLGTGIIVQEIAGLDLPPMRTGDTPRAFGDGDFAGIDTLASRFIVFTVDVIEWGERSVDAQLIAIRRAFAPLTGLAEFRFQHEGLPELVAFCRPRRAEWGLDRAYYRGAVRALLLGLYAPDPRLYAGEAGTAWTGVAKASGGHYFAVTFPHNFGTAGASGQLIAENAGVVSTAPVITIRGAIDGPLVENLTTAEHFELARAFTATDTVVIDSTQKSITLNGGGNLRPAMTPNSNWPWLAPGRNFLRFRARRGAPEMETTMTVTWRSAWV